MAREINTTKALEGTPRPHYLVGKATYEQEDRTHLLRGTIHFSSENPSIGDRAEKYLLNPHVNSGDVCFAVWNGAHIIADLLGYSQRTLVNEINIVPHKPIPPDADLSLEVRVTEEANKIDRNGKPYALGKVAGKIYLENNLLAEVNAGVFARK